MATPALGSLVYIYFSGSLMLIGELAQFPEKHGQTFHDVAVTSCIYREGLG